MRQEDLTRKEFAYAAAAGAAAILAGCTTKAEAKAKPTSKPRAAKNAGADGKIETEGNAASDDTAHAPLTCLDMHADTVTRIAMQEYPPYDKDMDRYVGDLASNNGELSADHMGDIRWAQCYAIWLPDEDAEISHIDWYRTSAKWFHKQMRKHDDRFTQARTRTDVSKILDDGKVAAILTVENAACLDAGLEVVDEFAKDGVLIAGITWNGTNVLGSGNDDANAGLTDLGRQYIAALEEHDIVVDISHLNEKGFWEVNELATKPYIATHSNSRAICDHPRNLTDDQFKAIVASGGLVGLNFHDGFVRNGGTLYTFDELAAHVEHWLGIEGGEDALALGSDRDGAVVPSWLADCGLQSLLFARFEETFGQTIANKLFYQNALRFFGTDKG